jgi:hypothetical protein
LKVWETLRELIRKLRGTYIVIETREKIIDLQTGKEISEEKNGCVIKGLVALKPALHKIIDISGRGSKGCVIPSNMLSRFSNETLTGEVLKIYLIERVDGEPIVALVSPKDNLKIGKEAD